MTTIYRLLRWLAECELKMINDRMTRLYDCLIERYVDIEEYIWRRNDICVERVKAKADYDKWNSALSAIEIHES